MQLLSLLRSSVIPALVIASAVSVAHAEVFRYRQGGPWEDVSDGTVPGWGVNPASPGIRVPGDGDEARINWAGSTVTLDYEAPTFQRLMIGVDEAGILEVKSGGVITTTQDVLVGNNGFTDGTMIIEDGGVVNVGRISWVARGGGNDLPLDIRGFLTIEAGGTLNVASHLWWGSTGEAFVDISGTLNQSGGILGLGTNDFTRFGGTATVNVLSGGELNLNNIRAGDTESIQPGSKIDIQGTGRVTLPGDFTEPLEMYRDANLLYGNGVAGSVTIETEPGAQPSGDFNEDGIVDAADYTVYRDNFGSAAGLPNDNDLGVVGQTHYDLWAANFGETTSLITVVTAGLPTASFAVPEPSSQILLIAAIGMVCKRRARVRIAY